MFIKTADKTRLINLDLIRTLEVRVIRNGGITMHCLYADEIELAGFGTEREAIYALGVISNALNSEHNESFQEFSKNVCESISNALNRSVTKAVKTMSDNPVSSNLIDFSLMNYQTVDRLLMEKYKSRLGISSEEGANLESLMGNLAGLEV